MVLNGQRSNWSSVLTGVPQGLILRPLLFLTYINDLPDGLESSVKLLADDTSLFPTIYELNMSVGQLDKNLKKNHIEHTNGKLSLIQTYQSKHKKLSFPEKLTK